MKEEELKEKEAQLLLREEELKRRESLLPPTPLKREYNKTPLTDYLSTKDAFTVLSTLEHPTHGYLREIFITEDKSYSFSKGSELVVDEPLDPVKDAALIHKGIKTRKVTLPGLYIGRSKVIADYTRAEVLKQKKEITEQYDAWLLAEDEKKAREMETKPNATARKIAKALQEIVNE